MCNFYFGKESNDALLLRKKTHGYTKRPRFVSLGKGRGCVLFMVLCQLLLDAICRQFEEARSSVKFFRTCGAGAIDQGLFVDLFICWLGLRSEKCCCSRAASFFLGKLVCCELAFLVKIKI